jgi:glutamate-1-semialdehyde 2,1-aminomutase
MVRLVNSGTEATMSAIRVARGFTGRDLIVKFEGCYHGHVDSLLVKAGSGLATLGIADTQGVPKAFCDTTIALPFNSPEAVEAAFRTHGDRIAAVIVEPVVGNMGCVPPLEGYLQFLREVTERHGALLILDEVMTGFRVAFGGAQQRFGIVPDLTTLGKVIGGGLPVGAYGGRKRHHEQGCAGGPGLSGGHALRQSARRGRGARHAAPSQGAPGNLRQLEARAAALCANVPAGITVNRVGAMFTFFFHPGPVTDWDSAKVSDTARFGRYSSAPCSIAGSIWRPRNSRLHFSRRRTPTKTSPRRLPQPKIPFGDNRSRPNCPELYDRNTGEAETGSAGEQPDR